MKTIMIITVLFLGLPVLGFSVSGTAENKENELSIRLPSGSIFGKNQGKEEGFYEKAKQEGVFVYMSSPLVPLPNEDAIKKGLEDGQTAVSSTQTNKKTPKEEANAVLKDPVEKASAM